MNTTHASSRKAKGQKKIKYQYSASPTGQFSEIKAKIYGPILVEIAGQKGELHPADVVEKARDKSNPLHREFIWDDSKAAEAFRLDQARRIIRGIIITAVIRPRKEPVEIRLFHSVKNAQGQRSYGLLNVLNRDADARQQIEAQALKALIYWQGRLKVYKALPEVVAALEGLKLEEQLAKTEPQQEAPAGPAKAPLAGSDRKLLPASAAMS